MHVTSVEALIAACAARGDWADLGAMPEADRVVSGEFIRSVLAALPLSPADHQSIADCRPDYAAVSPAAFAPIPVAAAGLRLRGAIIRGVIDLSSCAGPGGAPLPALVLDECRLLGHPGIAASD